jgi:hypothetical protein
VEASGSISGKDVVVIFDDKEYAVDARSAVARNYAGAPTRLI